MSQIKPADGRKFAGPGAAPSDESDISEASEDVTETTWIQWFCSLKGNEFYTDVDEEFIQDEFNLTGLSSQVPYYEYAMDMILDIDPPDEEHLTEAQQEVIESASEMLYGLIHARYVLTQRGMQQMLEKYKLGDFGRCPHVYCQGQHALPIGLSDIPRTSMVKLFCPKCQNMYFPSSVRVAAVDGAHFGTTFSHFFLLVYPELVPVPCTAKYVPRIFGFKIYPTAKSNPKYREKKRIESIAMKPSEGDDAESKKGAKKPERF